MSSQSIYDRFNLLPPPPPTAFSHYDAANRMRLPDFQSVPEARDFLDRMMVFRHEASINVVRTVLGCVNAALLIGIATKEVWLYVQRRRWLVRLLYTSDGIVIVPSINAVFASLGCVFLLVNCAFAFVHLRYQRRDLPLPHLPLWQLLQYLPLWVATFWSSWASYHGRVPGSRRYQLLKRKSRGPSMSPFATNCFWIAMPALLALIILLPALLSSRFYELARSRTIPTLAELSTAQELTEELLVSIQETWLLMRHFAFWLSITCVIWVISALSLSILYAIVSFRLVFKLHQHLSALLQLKHAQDIVGTVRMDCLTLVTVSPTEHAEKRRIRRGAEMLESPVVLLNEERDDILLTSPTSALFPTVNPTSAKHEPLGDGTGFRRVIWLYGLQTISIFVGCIIFAGLAIGTIVTVSDVEANKLEQVTNIIMVLTQVIATGLGLMLVVCNAFLERSQTFLTLMHGSYRAGGIDGPMCERSTPAAPRSTPATSGRSTPQGDKLSSPEDGRWPPRSRGKEQLLHGSGAAQAGDNQPLASVDSRVVRGRASESWEMGGSHHY
ncbi:unnamed protein product [Tilletia controversa]|uniref:Uncharacterized protein n=1 Tax=Tilletia controversa TaxID=13291 RepID=A0A8X7MW46_9BASI|nr:hypothetical protein CF328_g3080 [Tilletia controversa]KAE8252315.1 hypothetical protein A4X06_0g2276 [Tilletia controversa]CAD6907230.1 unnamed protein product [Tilletia controversa]CAD6917315.1 unnamed protein product [Tilletia controversa]CAD6978509.1 unnamed protein product [Tilletia controversa]